MAATCSHQDPERTKVSASAHGVASLRGMEMKRGPEERVFDDPYAEMLGGQVGPKWIQFMEDAYFKERPDRDTPENREAYCQRLATSLAIRTNRIDHGVCSILQAHPEVQQVCVLGAGLDTRPWRLSTSVDREIQYFELDFPEIFHFKLNALQEAGASIQPPFVYHQVEVDLSLPTWSDILVTKYHFDPTRPTIWILEGLTMYLLDEEMETLARFVSTLSALGSHLLVDCFATHYRAARTGAWRFRHDDLAIYFQPFGWNGVSTDYKELGRLIGRPNDASPGGYFLYQGTKVTDNST